MDYKQLASKQTEAMQAMTKAVAKRDAEIKKYGEAQEKTGKTIDKLDKNITEIQKEMKELQAQGGRLGAAASNFKTAGDLFTKSDVYTKSTDQDIIRGRSVDIKSFHKAVTTDEGNEAGNAGGVLTPQRVPGWIDETEGPLSIRDLLNVQPTTSNSVEYVRVLDFENNADYRPETTAAAQSSVKFDLVRDSVSSIAHWMPASREILNDAPQMRAFIDNKLRYGVKAKEDKALLYGTGVGNTITGLMVDEDVQVFSRYGQGDTQVDILRRALTDVRMTDYASSGFILNPMDFEDLELLKGSDQHYIWLNIPTPNGPQLFRLPVSETVAMEKGNFLTGAFKQGATLYDRENASVRFSESHEDFFTKGMVAILAEERLALAVERPNAFVRGSFTNPNAG